jgi:hypothetical protein
MSRMRTKAVEGRFRAKQWQLNKLSKDIILIATNDEL